MAEAIDTTVQDTQATDTAAQQEAAATPEKPAQDNAPQPAAEPDREAEKPAVPDKPETEVQEPAAPVPEAEKPKAEEAPDLAALNARMLDAELRAAAALAGIPANKIPHAVRMADRDKAADAQDLTQFATEQIQQIIRDIPELGQQPAATGSAGNHARTDAKDPFIKGFEA